MSWLGSNESNTTKSSGLGDAITDIAFPELIEILRSVQLKSIWYSAACIPLHVHETYTELTSIPNENWCGIVRLALLTHVLRFSFRTNRSCPFFQTGSTWRSTRKHRATGYHLIQRVNCTQQFRHWYHVIKPHPLTAD